MWVRANIPTEIFKKEEAMYKFLEDFIDFCDESNSGWTFHFFIENYLNIDDILELRMECVDAAKHSGDVNSWLSHWLYANRDIINNVPALEMKRERLRIDTDYKDEIESFGEDGWQIAKKIFEYTSRAAVHIKTGKAENLFRETKFIHCFLNQCGYDSLKESAFHSMAAWQMMVKHCREEKTGEPKK